MADETDGTRQKEQALFLAEYKRTRNASKAAEAAGIGRTTAYRWKQSDEAFAEKWGNLHDEYVDLLESEATRRAAQGVDKPVFYQGQECGQVREYSDLLLIFLLKANRPNKYRETIRQEHIGADGAPLAVQHTIAGLAHDETTVNLLAELSNRLCASGDTIPGDSGEGDAQGSVAVAATPEPAEP